MGNVFKLICYPREGRIVMGAVRRSWCFYRRFPHVSQQGGIRPRWGPLVSPWIERHMDVWRNQFSQWGCAKKMQRWHAQVPLVLYVEGDCWQNPFIHSTILLNAFCLQDAALDIKDAGGGEANQKTTKNPELIELTSRWGERPLKRGKI